MSDQNILNVINTVLQGDTRKNALDFIAFLNANEIPFNEAGNYLDVYLDGKNVCSVLITGEAQMPGPWTIWSDQEPGSWITWPDEGNGGASANVAARMQEIIWAHINPCASCGGDCSPGKTKYVLGKRFDGLCSSAIAFTNPDAEALACAKEMVLQRKADILKAPASA